MTALHYHYQWCHGGVWVHVMCMQYACTHTVQYAFMSIRSGNISNIWYLTIYGLGFNWNNDKRRDKRCWWQSIELKKLATHMKCYTLKSVHQRREFLRLFVRFFSLNSSFDWNAHKIRINMRQSTWLTVFSWATAIAVYLLSKCHSQWKQQQRTHYLLFFFHLSNNGELRIEIIEI